MKGQQVGHVQKAMAAKLAPLLDQMKNMTVEASVASRGTAASMPVTINLLTTSSRPLSNFELEPIYTTITGSLRHYFHRAKKLSHVTPSPTEMKRAPLQALTTGLANIASASAGEDQKPEAHEASTSSPDRDRGPSLKALTAGLTDKEAELEVEMTNVDWANAHEELDQMFDQQTKNRLEKLPDYAMPPQLQNLELFDFQKDGIRWLIHQERNQSAISPFIKEIFQNGTKKWMCTITRCIFTSPPKGICGGVLADGKYQIAYFCILAFGAAD
jgi:hypothetical protein